MKKSYFHNVLRHGMFRLIVGVGAGLCVLAVSPSLWAHGELGEELEHFEEYVPQYKKEVAKLAEKVDALVEAYEADELEAGAVAGLIKRWKEVGVHGAIETRAGPLYAGVWQGLIGLQQAVANQESAASIARKGEALKAALWQGLGGVRLAASQVKESSKAGHEESHGSDEHAEAGKHRDVSSPDKAIRSINHALNDAVAIFKKGDAEKAKSIVHTAYMEIFEGLEGDLIEMNPDLVTQLEADFNAGLPLLIDEGAAVSKVRAKLKEMRARLQTAKKLLLKAEKARSEVFGQ